MKIARVEAIPLRIPFTAGAPEAAAAGRPWIALDSVLIRVETEDGLVGWGEGFSYNCRRAVQAAVEDMVAPRAIGRDATAIAQLMRELQIALHIFGRYGITLFALSGLDIALWDLAGKAAGLPLHRLIGGAHRRTIPGYASLYKYQDPDLVAARCEAALAEGYDAIKLHETTVPEVAAARAAIGPGVPLMVDTNCPWTPHEAHAAALAMKPYDLHWLEEPIFPPEDFQALARLQRDSGVPLAAGENASTAHEFRKMFDAGAVTYAQPSVTKVGGVTELLKVAAMAETSDVALMLHSPYFGPGWLATLHLMAALPNSGWIERFHLDLEASLYGDWVDPVGGCFRVPEGPGLGVEPDLEVIERFRL